MAKHSEITVEKGKEIQKAVPARGLHPLDEMERLMERVFGDFPERGWVRPWRAEWPAWPEMAEMRMPKVDVIDREEDVLVRAELPGVEKKDLEISTTDTTVTIKATTLPTRRYRRRRDGERERVKGITLRPHGGRKHDRSTGNYRYVRDRQTTAGGAGEDVNLSGGSCVGSSAVRFGWRLPAGCGLSNAVADATVVTFRTKRAAMS